MTSVSVRGPPHNAVGDGVANDAPAIQQAIDAVFSAGGGIVLVPTGAYLILSPLVGKSGVTIRGEGSKSILRIGALTYAFLTEGQLSTDTSNTLASTATIGATTVTLSAGKGANFSSGDYVLITSEANMPQGGCTNKRGEIVRVQAVNSDLLTLESPLIYAHDTASTARARKISPVLDFVIEDLTVDGNYSANSTTFRRSQTVFSWCIRPRASRVMFRDLGQQALSFGGCLGAIVEGCQFDGLASDDDSNYGYAVHETAVNIGLRMTNCTGERVRHMFTTTDSSTPFAPGYGQPSSSRITNSTAIWPRAAGFDTHEAGLDISFSGCSVVGGGRAGYQLRSLRTTVTDCTVSDCIGEAIYIDSSAQDSLIQNIRAYRTNLGAYLSVPRTDRGAIFDNGLRSAVKDCQIELCGGPAIEAYAGAAGFYYSGNLIRNPAQITVTNKVGIYINTSASVEADIHHNRVVVTDGKCTSAIKNMSGNVIGFVMGNRASGIAIPYTFAQAMQHQGNSPGPLLSASNQSVAKAITSDAIDVTDLTSPSVLVAAEGGVADNLATINGGVSGQIIFIRRNAPVNITVKHGTGNIFLNGAADKVLGGAFDVIQLVKVGTNWIGNFFADI